MSDFLLEADGLRKSYGPGRAMSFDAVKDVSISLLAGENVGLVGDVGAGKTTVARMITGFLPPDKGTVRVEGQDVATMSRKELLALPSRVHLIPQDLATALPPKSKVERIVDEPLDWVKTNPEHRRPLILAALTAVALPADDILGRRISTLTPAAKARVALARALILRPRLVVADDVTGALDPTAAADLVQLMAELGILHGVGYLFVTRDLGLAEFLCDRLVVLDEGRIVDQGPTDQVMNRPLHPRSAEFVKAARRQQPPAAG